MSDLERWMEYFVEGEKVGFACRHSHYDPKTRLITTDTFVAFQTHNGEITHHHQCMRGSGLPIPKWSGFRYESKGTLVSEIEYDTRSITGTHHGKLVSKAAPPNLWPGYGVQLRARALPLSRGQKFEFTLLDEEDLGISRGGLLHSHGPDELKSPRGKQDLWRMDAIVGSKLLGEYWLNRGRQLVAAKHTHGLEVWVKDRQTALEGLPDKIGRIAEHTVPEVS